MDVGPTITGAFLPEPSANMKGAFGTIRSYILWQHERGTLHYDIMVTLILIFVFFSPRVINFNDKPAPLNRHPTGVVVSSDSDGSLVYEIEASQISTNDDGSLRNEFARVIHPISGDVTVTKYEALSNSKGQVTQYRVWVKRK